jgi:mycofactocin precursor
MDENTAVSDEVQENATVVVEEDSLVEDVSIDGMCGVY